MKLKVIEALHSKELVQRERFQVLFDLYRKHPEALPTLNRSFNAQGYSPANLRSIEYELKKTYKIKDSEVASFSAKETKVVRLDVKALSAELLAELQLLDFDVVDYSKVLKPLANRVAKELDVKLESTKKVDLIAFLKGHTTNTVEAAPNPFIDAPEDVKQGIKLRDEFPFLKDETCPDKFKILVSDKFTAYENFKSGREEIKKLLAEGATEADLFELAKSVVENFELNLEIYDELNYYKEHGQILGKHPIFKEEMMQATVDAYSTKELLKTQGNLRSYISRETKVIEKMEDGDQKAALMQKVMDWTAELTMIDKRLAETK
ncbi:MAG TPA: hypothetical protein VLY84_00220 [Dysgonamonadaceae bacterium]|nr:hypothetical protein [Dysgonamonadaceae bacterium]